MWNPSTTPFDARDTRATLKGKALHVRVEVFNLPTTSGVRLWLYEDPNSSAEPPARLRDDQPDVRLDSSQAFYIVTGSFQLDPGDESKTFTPVVGVGSEGDRADPFSLP